LWISEGEEEVSQIMTFSIITIDPSLFNDLGAIRLSVQYFAKKLPVVSYQRIVLPQPAIPCNQRNEFDSSFQLEYSSPFVNHSPV
jgi:hypothetical protein